MMRWTPTITRTDTLFPATRLFLSVEQQRDVGHAGYRAALVADIGPVRCRIGGDAGVETKDAARLGGGAGFGVAPQPIHHAGEIGGGGIRFDVAADGLAFLEQPCRDNDDRSRDHPCAAQVAGDRCATHGREGTERVRTGRTFVSRAPVKTKETSSSES